eukprot:5520379-Prymnesium_polylepis.1
MALGWDARGAATQSRTKRFVCTSVERSRRRYTHTPMQHAKTMQGSNRSGNRMTNSVGAVPTVDAVN